jgi:predicted enzyme related to lactoylglutathione lyase
MSSATNASYDKRQQVAVWFEIPATDLDRAARFYQQLFGAPLQRADFGMPIAVFPYRAEGGASGCLAQSPTMQPSRSGSLIYLNADPSLDAALARAEEAGGRVVQPRTALPPGMGFFAKIEDTEGNQVGLHALA